MVKAVQKHGKPDYVTNAGPGTVIAKPGMTTVGPRMASAGPGMATTALAMATVEPSMTKTNGSFINIIRFHIL